MLAEESNFHQLHYVTNIIAALDTNAQLARICSIGENKGEANPR